MQAITLSGAMRLAGIERDAQGLVGFDALQQIHVVSQADASARAVRHQIVPGGPGQPLFRQQTGVGMQDRFVGLIGNRRQHFPLGRAGVAQQRQGLVTVTGEKYRVEAFAVVGQMQIDKTGLAIQPVHRRMQADPLPEWRHQAFHVGAGRTWMVRHCGRSDTESSP